MIKRFIKLILLLILCVFIWIFAAGIEINRIYNYAYQMSGGGWDTSNAKESISVCRKNNNYDQTFCLGYLLGYLNATSYQQTKLLEYVDSRAPLIDNKTPTGFCTEDHVTLGQIDDILQKYIKENPQTHHKPMEEILALALQKAFPCKNADEEKTN